MSKLSQPIEWSVGEEQFAQVSAAVADQKKHAPAAPTHRRNGRVFLQILSGLAIAAAVYMAATSYYSTPEFAPNQIPDRLVSDSLDASIQEPATEQAEVSALEQQAIQEILALDISMELGPQLSKLASSQPPATVDRSSGRSITEKRNSGEVDPALLGLQRQEFLLDINFSAPFAIATILVENPNDEQWYYGAYQEKRFYQRDGAVLRRANPAEYLSGPPQWIETVHLLFEFHEPEREYFLAIADEMESAQARLLKIVSLSYSGKEFRPPEPPRLLTDSGTDLNEAKLTLVSVPFDVPGLNGAGARQKIASPLAGKRPTNFSDEEWLSQKVIERLVHLEVRKHSAMKVGVGDYRWDRMGSALSGWLQKELMGRRSPWHAEAATTFDPSLDSDASLPLSVLFTTDPNGWPSRGEMMQNYMLAETMIEYAVQTHGIGKVGDLLHGLSIHYTWADLIPAVYDVSVGEFEAGWNEYLRKLAEER